MKKILPSKYYDKNDGFFIANEIRFSFGRRGSFLVQTLLNHYEKAVKENKLLNGFVFIPADGFFKESSYTFNSSGFKFFVRHHGPGAKWYFLEVENFGAEDGLFFKIDLEALFKNVIPHFKEGYAQYLETVKNTKGE